MTADAFAVMREGMKVAIARSPTCSIGCGLVDVVDDKHINGTFRGFELQAELLLQRCKQRWRIRIDRGRFDAGRRLSALLRGERQREFPVAGEAGAIDDHPSR